MKIKVTTDTDFKISSLIDMASIAYLEARNKDDTSCEIHLSTGSTLFSPLPTDAVALAIEAAKAYEKSCAADGQNQPSYAMFGSKDLSRPKAASRVLDLTSARGPVLVEVEFDPGKREIVTREIPFALVPEPPGPPSGRPSTGLVVPGL